MPKDMLESSSRWGFARTDTPRRECGCGRVRGTIASLRERIPQLFLGSSPGSGEVGGF